MAPDATDTRVAAQFGQNLRRARRRARLNQTEVGELAGLHRTEISLLERGGRTPRLSTIVRLAGALEVPLGELMDAMAWVPPSPRRVDPGGFEFGGGAASS